MWLFAFLRLYWNNVGILLRQAEYNLRGAAMRVMIAEDDPTLQAGLRQAIERMGHKTHLVSNGLHADLLLTTEPFDLLVLDLGLPRLDGIKVLERLRKRRQALPVLILSARDKTQDRVVGLNLGADDYMTKPFDLSEFEARVRALLRREHVVSKVVGSLEWFWDSRDAFVAGKAMELSRHDANVLEALIKSPTRIVPKNTLAMVLGEDGQSAGDNMVEVYVSRLRRKLADAAAGIEIRTVRGLGYRLCECTHET